MLVVNNVAMMTIFEAISFFLFNGLILRIIWKWYFDVQKLHVLLRLLLHFVKPSFRKVLLFFSYFQQHWVLFFYPFWLEREENEWYVNFILHLFNYQFVRPSSDSHFAFLHFFFLGMFLIPVSCTMSWPSVHSSSGTLSIRSSPLNLFLTSTV